MESNLRSEAIAAFPEQLWLKTLSAVEINGPTLLNRVLVQDYTNDMRPRLYRMYGPVHMVRVVNSTPEPDGTHKIYWLRVSPDIHNPIEAVAYTFGFHAHAYMPSQET